MIGEFINEFKKFDGESIFIVVYSTFILLISTFLRRTWFFFPREPFLEKLLLLGIIYGLAPFLPFFLFKNKPGNYGINFGNFKIWIKDVVFFYIIMVAILFVVFKFTNVGQFYPLYRRAGIRINYFLIYQVVQLFHMFSWEFFFRGFMLFGLAKKLDKQTSILIQTIPFALMHFRKPPLEAYGSIIAGIFLGIIAFRGNSFLPCAILHFLVAITADLLA